jgi:hypothetical protein
MTVYADLQMGFYDTPTIAITHVEEYISEYLNDTFGGTPMLEDMVVSVVNDKGVNAVVEAIQNLVNAMPTN